MARNSNFAASTTKLAGRRTAASTSRRWLVSLHAFPHGFVVDNEAMRFFCCSLLLAACTSAQTPTEPPVLIQLLRKQGFASSLRPYSQARATLNVLGMISITGEPETWALEIHDSF